MSENVKQLQKIVDVPIDLHSDKTIKQKCVDFAINIINYTSHQPTKLSIIDDIILVEWQIDEKALYFEISKNYIIGSIDVGLVNMEEMECIHSKINQAYELIDSFFKQE